MSGVISFCCCDDDDDDEPPDPPPPGPGDEPDPDWTSGYYAAGKYARVVRDGWKDFRTYYYGTRGATGVLPYDTGERFAAVDWHATVGFPSAATEVSRWTFLAGAEQVILNYFNSGGTLVSSAGEFTPYSPTGTANGIEFIRANDGGVSYYPASLTVTNNRVTGVQAAPPATFEANGNAPIPESLLDTVDDKIAFGQFKSGGTRVIIHENPTDVVSAPYSEGPLTGTRHRCLNVPEFPTYIDVPYQSLFNVVIKAFTINEWSSGLVSDLQQPFTGLKMRRDKQRVQFGSKPSAGTILKTYRKFSVPEGFNLIGPTEPWREPSNALQVLGKRLPANSEFLEEEEISLIENAAPQTFGAEPQEVYYFDGRPFSFPEALPTVAEVLTPLHPKMVTWRTDGPRFTRFPPIVQIVPFGLVIQWTHEDRCLKFEIWRKVNAGAESLLTTFTGPPGTDASGNPFTNPDNPSSDQWPLGYVWTYKDEAVAEGNTYTYRLKAYYDTAYKSAFSESYAVTI